VEAFGERGADLGADDHADGKADSAAYAFVERAGGDVDGGAGEGHDREDEVRCGGGVVDGEVEEVDERGDVDDAAANPEETGDVADDGANDDAEGFVEPDIVGRLVAGRLREGRFARFEYEVDGGGQHEGSADGVEGASGDVVGGEGSEDGAGNAGQREEYAGAVVDALHAGVCPGTGEGVEEHDGQGDAGDRFGKRVGVEDEQQGDEDEAAARADECAKGPDEEAEGYEQEVLNWHGGILSE